MLQFLLLTLAFSKVEGVQVSCLENLRGKAGRARVEIVVGAGALNESKSERGVAHLLEHLLLRPLGFDHSNGATSWDYTTYHQDVRADALTKATLELLEAVARPNFSDEAFSLEQKIVLRELSDRGITTELRDPIFSDTDLARAPGGSAQSVRELSPAKARDFHSRHYKRGNMAVLIRGAVDCKSITATITPKLSAIPSGAPTPRPKTSVSEPGRRATPARQGNFSKGVYWYEATPKEEVILRVVAKHLEQRALEELRKQRGLTYSPTSNFLRRGGGGLLSLTVTTDGKSSEVDDWYEKKILELQQARDPRALLKPAIKAVLESMENDYARVALAAIREEPAPSKLLTELKNRDLIDALPKLLDQRRSFGSTVPQSNVISIVILVIFGGLVLGAALYAGRKFMSGA